MGVSNTTTCSVSQAAAALWAKTGGRDNPQLWEPLVVHIADAGEVARLLWREWLAPHVRVFVCTETGLAEDEAETLVTWLASVHDIGKATPSFQSKVVERAERVRNEGLVFSSRSEACSHAYMGEVILDRWLERRGWKESVFVGYGCVVGGHHGRNPDEDDINRIRSRNRIDPLAVMGNDKWEQVQDEILGWSFLESGAETLEDRLRERALPAGAQVILLGLVIMADWISSNSDLFVLEESFRSWNCCQRRARKAWSLLGLPQPLKLQHVQQDDNQFFKARFPNLPVDAVLRPVQRRALDATRAMDEPCLMIVEESMGGGKTEAALMCCEVLMERFGASGIAFLLPTQATSDAMFARVRSWLDVLLSTQRTESVQDVHLLHGKAALNEDFATLPKWGASWMGDDSASQESVIAHQWFGGSKRGLLAPFVVGTVDQLLMASLKAKHVHLRHLGLAGKVVVIDEVHAYDAYMSTYLDRVLEFLGAYGTPVVLLSATLPPSRRSDLLNAYRGGTRRRLRTRVVLKGPPRLGDGLPAYPLISTVRTAKDAQVVYSTVPPTKELKSVHVGFLDDSSESLVSLLDELLADGGCACVLRDTVRRAQTTYELLRKRYGNDIILTHSRFIAADRAYRDSMLNRMLGRDQMERPQRLVVVGTQVLEQSLDVDFDLLVTDVAPVDLLLQRMGRLHRHAREGGECQRPKALEEAWCIVTGVLDWAADVPEFARGIASVYQRSTLMRSIVALRDGMDADGRLCLPTCIAPLVEQVYEGETHVPVMWAEKYEEALRREKESGEQKRLMAQQWLLPRLSQRPCATLRGWMRNPVRVSNEDAGRAAVRDSEESLEVVVVRRNSVGYLVLPWVAERYGIEPWLGTGAEAPEDSVARVAALCTVRLPPTLTVPCRLDATLDALERCMIPGWQDSRWLRGSFVLVTDVKGEARLCSGAMDFELRYTEECGLELLEERGTDGDD